jgi:prepilin-type N-terminal cleavage/methylation domain-containing protein
MRTTFGRFTLVEVLVVIVIICICIPTGLFVPERKAVAALQTQGFSDVLITHRAIWFVALRGGEKSDAVRFTATATNPAGKPVTVYVFSGWLFKGATIRTP